MDYGRWTMDDGQYDQLENKINDINNINYFYLGTCVYWNLGKRDNGENQKCGLLN